MHVMKSDLISILGYTQRTRNYESAMHTLQERKLIAMTIPDKPRSKNQKYRLTDKGRAVLKEMEK